MTFLQIPYSTFGTDRSKYDGSNERLDATNSFGNSHISHKLAGLKLIQTDWKRCFPDASIGVTERTRSS